MKPYRLLTLITCLVANCLLVQAAWASPSCSVSISGGLSFGNLVSLAGVPDATTHTGNALSVACSTDVGQTPTLYSSTPRVLSNGVNTLPFSLSLAGFGGTDLPSTPPGAGLVVPLDNTYHTFVLYGKILGTNISAVPEGTYSTNIILVLSY
jgi:hypothetical protein